MKFTALPIRLLALAAMTLTGLSLQAQNALLTSPVTAESTVQYVAGAAPTSFTNYVSGYDKVKYSATQPAKSYLKFDFGAQVPNTNYALKFSFKTTAASGGSQDVMLWALNQSYASFTNSVTNAVALPTLTWSNAQANYTGTNEPLFNAMLTSAANTATLVNTFVDSGGNSSSQGVTLPAPWGKYLFNNQIVIVLTATNGPDYNANGARFLTNYSYATFQPLTSGTQPPAISAIPNQVVPSTTSSGPISFTVSDPLDAAGSLTNITLALGNTNVTLLTTNITVDASGNATLTFTPVNNLAVGSTANVTVTLTLTDASGNSASSAFLLTVPPFVSLPVLLSGTNVNYLPPTNRIGAGSVTIPFKVVDTNIAASSLIVTGAISAYSTNLSGISFTSTTGIAPNTNNCTLTVTATGNGVGIVNVYVIDPTNAVTNTVPVAIMVLPDGSYAACDLMNYQPSASYTSGKAEMTAVSGSLWAQRSSSGTVNLITTRTPADGGIIPPGVPLIRGSSSGNSDQLRLVGSPYVAGSHKVLFASINAQWADLSLYGATAYYPGTSTGGLVEFAADGSASSTAMAAVCTVTNSANVTNNDGYFYLGLYNSTNAPSVNTNVSEAIPNWTTSGVLNSAVNVVASYDLDTGISQLWVNQTSSAGANVSLQDVAVTNLVNCNYLVLRQNSGMGNLIISHAAVKVVTKPIPAVTGIAQTGANQFQIKFTSAPGSGGTVTVVGSGTVNGTYNTVASTINESPTNSGNFTATVNGVGSQTFYRITQSGGTPTVAFPF